MPPQNTQTKTWIFRILSDLQGAKATEHALKRAEEAAKRTGVAFDKQSQVIKTSSEIFKDKFGASFLKVTDNIQNSTGAIQKWVTIIKDGRTTVNTMSKDMKLMGSAVEGTAQGFNGFVLQMAAVIDHAVQTIFVWTLLRTAIQALGRTIAEAGKFFEEFQFQLAQVKIVGDFTEKDINRLGKGVLELGTKFGGSFKEMSDAMVLWAQQGKGVNEILTLMEPTIISSTINQRSMKDTVEDLTSIMKAYHLSASQVLSVEDLITKVQLKHAISAKELSEGLRKLSSTASAFNITLKEQIALLTATQAVTRESGSTTARGISTVLARLTVPSRVEQAQAEIPGAKFFIDENGKETDVVTGKLKSQFEILKDVGERWGSLTTTQKQNFLILAAGVHQINRLASLMTNWAEVTETLTDELDANGSALKAFSDLSQTVTIEIQRTSNAWKEFLDNFRGSANFTIIAFLEALIASFKGLEQVIKDIKSGISLDTGIGSLSKLRFSNPNEEADNKRLQEENEAESQHQSRQRNLEIKTATEISKNADLVKRDLQRFQADLANEGLSDFAIAVLTRQRLLETGRKGSKGQLLDKDLIKQLNALDTKIGKSTRDRERTVELAKQEVLLEKMVASGATEVEIQKQKIEFERQRANAIGDNIDLVKSEIELQKILAKQIAEASKELQNSVSKGIQDVLLGKGNGQNILTNFTETIKNTLSKNIADNIAGSLNKFTGLGDIFGKLSATIQNNPIVAAHVQGATLAAPILTAAIVAGAVQAKTGGNIGDIINNSAEAQRQRAANGGGGNAGVLQQLFGGQAGVQTLGKAIGGGFAAFGAFQSAKQGDTFGAVSQGALAGFALGGPWGAAIGAGAGLLGSQILGRKNGGGGGGNNIFTKAPFMHYDWKGWGAVGNLFDPWGLFSGFFRKKKPEVTIEEETKNFQVSSRIDVTNKKLDVVNRNLVALRQSFETFILPESAYFSEARNLSDQFSISSRRGLIG